MWMSSPPRSRADPDKGPYRWAGPTRDREIHRTQPAAASVVQIGHLRGRLQSCVRATASPDFWPVFLTRLLDLSVGRARRRAPACHIQPHDAEPGWTRAPSPPATSRAWRRWHVKSSMHGCSGADLLLRRCASSAWCQRSADGARPRATSINDAPSPSASPADGRRAALGGYQWAAANGRQVAGGTKWAAKSRRSGVGGRKLELGCREEGVGRQADGPYCDLESLPAKGWPTTHALARATR